MGAFIDFVSDGRNVFATVAIVQVIVGLLLGSMRELRFLLMLAAISAVIHFAFFQPDSVGLIASILFVIANGMQLALLLARSRAGLMRDEERELVEQVLEVEEPSQQRRLLDLIEWRDVAEGDVLMRQGQTRPPLIYIASGAAEVAFDGALVGTAGPGDFLGEMSLMSGETASAGVTVTSPMRIARFDRDGLLRLAGGLPEVSRALDRAMNRGMAAKIARMNAAAAKDGD